MGDLDYFLTYHGNVSLWRLSVPKNSDSLPLISEMPLKANLQPGPYPMEDA
jgi:hypothetical protein